MYAKTANDYRPLSIILFLDSTTIDVITKKEHPHPCECSPTGFHISVFTLFAMLFLMWVYPAQSNTMKIINLIRLHLRHLKVLKV